MNDLFGFLEDTTGLESATPGSANVLSPEMTDDPSTQMNMLNLLMGNRDKGPSLSILKRPDGVIQITISPLHLTRYHERTYAASLTAFLSNPALTNQVIEISMPQISQIDMGRNESRADEYALSLAYIGLISELSKRAQVIGVVDLQYSGMPVYFLLACRSLLISPVGEMIISRPSNWASTAYVNAAKYYLQLLLTNARDKGILKDEEVADILGGKGVRLTYQTLITRQSEYVTVIQ